MSWCSQLRIWLPAAGTKTLPSQLLVSGRRRFRGVQFWEEITLTRANEQLARFSFCIDGLYAHIELVQSAVIFFILADGKAQAVARRQAAHNSRQTIAVIFDVTDMDRFAPALLRQAFGAAGQTYAAPANQRLADGKQKLVKRSHVRCQRVEDCILPNQDLLRRLAVFGKDWGNSIREPDDRGL